MAGLQLLTKALSLSAPLVREARVEDGTALLEQRLIVLRLALHDERVVLCLAVPHEVEAGRHSRQGDPEGRSSMIHRIA